MTSAGRLAVAAVVAGRLASGRAGAEAVPLTLAHALETAERQNPELIAARERVQAAEAGGQAAGRGAWPRLSLASDWFRTANPARVFASKLNRGEFTQEDFAIDRLNHPDALAHLTTSLLIELPLDVFGKVRAGAQGGAAQGRSAAAQREEAVQEVRLRVVETYRRAVLARAAVAATARALAGARARESDIEARVAEGAALQSDLLRARARRRQREADLAERQGEQRSVEAAVAVLLGAPAGTSYEATEPAPAPGPLDGDLAAWVGRALAERAALTAVRERQSATQWAERSERRSILPEITAYGQLQDDRGSFSNGQQSGSLGLVLRWSAFDPSRNKRLAAAAAESRAAAEDLRAAESRVRLEVELAWRRAQATRERYAAAAGGTLEGREALRVVQERRQAGMATLTDELETEAASLAEELDEMRAAADAAVADAALKRAAGEL